MAAAAGADLPVLAVLDDVRAALAGHWSAVLSAPPGAGKTTGVPAALLDEPWLAGQRIVLLQPRRLAARVVARRIAALLGTEVGRGVGLVTGEERRTSRHARIEVCTEGVLVRRLLADPGLPGTGLVVLDEFHERSLQADLALALTREVAAVLRDDLKVLVMSATLDGIDLAGVLDGAAVVRSEGRMFDVATRWHPVPAGAPLAPAVRHAVDAALGEGDGDVLVFLPGRADIRRARGAIGDRADVVVHDLHGGVAPAAQDAALRRDPAGRRRVVLSTSIAETSLTVDGVLAVVDAGLRRAAAHDPATGLTRLTTVPASRAEVEQRRGRAGRVAPGRCHRLFSAADLATRDEQPAPAIRTADLTDLVLTVAAWGAAPGDLALLDAPDPRRLAAARALLHDLGAIADDHGAEPLARDELTALGETVARLPVHPRLAAMLLAARTDERPTACRLAALVEERDVLRDVGDPDVLLRLEALDGRGTGAGRVDRRRAGRVRDQASRLQGLLGRLDVPAAPGPAAASTAATVARLAILAYPDRVGQVRQRDVLLAAGRHATLAGGTAFAGVDWLVALDVADASARARIHLAAAVTLDDLLAALPDRLAWQDVVAHDPGRDDVVVERQRRLGGIVVARAPLPTPDPGALAAALTVTVAARGLDALPWTPALRQLRRRAQLVGLHGAGLVDEGWPDLSDDVLLATLGDWLTPFLTGLRRARDLGRVPLADALRARFTHAQWSRLGELAPTHLTAPSGARHRLDYPEDGEARAPVLAAKLQEFLGAPVSPTVVAGRVPVVLHLLSPAGRPLQVTADLAGFWETAYPAVRGEMRGRYPKHHWPEDPRTAVATTRSVKHPRRR